MYELMLLNLLLNTKDIGILVRYGIDEEYFYIFRNVVKFIKAHYSQYGQVPDMASVCTEFSDFDIIEVKESADFLVGKLKENKLYNEFAPVVEQLGDKLKQNSFEAIDFIKSEIEKVMKSGAVGGSGYDIVKSAEDRLTEYKKRVDNEGLMGISTGIDLLDEWLHGWLSEDLVVIFARTNEGKSWILLYFLVCAWRLGYRVVMYSGEMGSNIVGFRFDTFNEHFSNLGLMNGRKELGKDSNRGMEDYVRYIEDLKTKDGFLIVTQKDFGGKPTVTQLEQLMELHKGDILGVDQISLMKDERKGENKRIQFTNISEDLYKVSEKLQKPILAVSQANRESVKDKKEKRTPELHEMSESDGVAQNATRVISIKNEDSLLRVSIKKNRYGLNNKEIMMIWDINYGIIRPMIDNGEDEESTQQSYGF